MENPQKSSNDEPKNSPEGADSESSKFTKKVELFSAQIDYF